MVKISNFGSVARKLVEVSPLADVLNDLVKEKQISDLTPEQRNNVLELLK